MILQFGTPDQCTKYLNEQRCEDICAWKPLVDTCFDATGSPHPELQEAAALRAHMAAADVSPRQHLAQTLLELSPVEATGQLQPTRKASRTAHWTTKYRDLAASMTQLQPQLQDAPGLIAANLTVHTNINSCEEQTPETRAAKYKAWARHITLAAPTRSTRPRDMARLRQRLLHSDVHLHYRSHFEAPQLLGAVAISELMDTVRLTQHLCAPTLIGGGSHDRGAAVAKLRRLIATIEAASGEVTCPPFGEREQHTGHTQMTQACHSMANACATYSDTHLDAGDDLPARLTGRSDDTSHVSWADVIGHTTSAVEVLAQTPVSCGPGPQGLAVIGAAEHFLRLWEAGMARLADHSPAEPEAHEMAVEDEHRHSQHRLSVQVKQAAEVIKEADLRTQALQLRALHCEASLSDSKRAVRDARQALSSVTAEYLCTVDGVVAHANTQDQTNT